MNHPRRRHHQRTCGTTTAMTNCALLYSPGTAFLRYPSERSRHHERSAARVSPDANPAPLLGNWVQDSGAEAATVVRLRIVSPQTGTALVAGPNFQIPEVATAPPPFRSPQTPAHTCADPLLPSLQGRGCTLMVGPADGAAGFVVDAAVGGGDAVTLRFATEEALAMEVGEGRALVEGVGVLMWSYGGSATAMCPFKRSPEGTLAAAVHLVATATRIASVTVTSPNCTTAPATCDV